MNKHIELVEKWLADNNSVSKEELIATANASYDTTYAAYTAYASGIAVNAVKALNVASNAAACAANAATTATEAAAYATTEAAEATYWVAKYHDITKGEDHE